MLDRETLMTWLAEVAAAANSPTSPVGATVRSVFENLLRPLSDRQAQRLQARVEAWLDDAAGADADTGLAQLTTRFELDADSRLTLAQPVVNSPELRAALVCAELLAVDASRRARVARCKRCAAFLVHDMATGKAGRKPLYCPGHAPTPTEKTQKRRERLRTVAQRKSRRSSRS